MTNFYARLYTLALCLLLTSAVSLVFSACRSTDSALRTANNRDAIVAIIRQGEWQTQITLAEFEDRYLETRRSAQEARQDSLAAYREFLERYIDFKLKVKDALDKGLDKDPEVLRELREYRNQLAQPYLVEKEVYDNAIRDLYEKRKYEIDASHILVFVAPDAAPADTQKAYQKIQEARRALQSGAPFDSVARQYSEDPSASQNGGRLGYFTGGMMVHQFEDAVYAAKVGELYGPFRTRFGYHLVKVWDKRPRTPDIRAAHILVQCGSSAEDTLKAYQKIRALYDSLQQGRDFAELARLYSEDPSTASRDGDIGFFGLGRTVKPFEEAAFALKNIGDISPIIRSPFGYHIIKLLDRKPPKSLEEEREELKFMLRRNPEKINAETGRLTARLKKLHSYRENPVAIAALHAVLDTTAEGYTKLESLSSDTVRNMLCFAFAQRQYTIDSLLSYMRAFVGKRKLTEKDLIAYRDSYAQRELIDYEITLLETRYPEFAKLMRDYTDGILLFTVSERTVWDKSNANDSIARAYFDAHRNEFQFGERVQISQIVVSSKSLIEALREELVEKRRTLDLVSADSVKQARRALRAALAQLKRGTKDYASKKDSLLRRLASLKVDDQPRTFEVLAQRYSEKYDTATGAKVGLFQQGENMLADIVFQSEPGSISAPITFEERYYLIRLDRREPARLKTFEEALPEIYSRYQDERNRELEAAWVKRLREKSQIQVFEETLKAAFLSTPATQTAMTK